MTTFVSAQYVANEAPPPDQTIRAVDDEGVVWWLDDNCQQGDWLRFVEEGNTVKSAEPTPEAKPA